MAGRTRAGGIETEVGRGQAANHTLETVPNSNPARTAAYVTRACELAQPSRTARGEREPGPRTQAATGQRRQKTSQRSRRTGTML